MDRKTAKLKKWTWILLAAAVLMIRSPAQAAEEKDYILGRPMTEAEIEEQKDLEPELTEFPELDITLPESSGVSSNKSSLPSSYDARDKNLITSVKNQLPYGTCWAFSAISSAETSLIRNGVFSSSLDLSELQLTYFFYNTVADSFGGTAGDSTTALTTDYLMQGGNGIFTTFALASWVGVAQESVAKYEDASASLTLADSLARSSDVGHMQNAYWFSLTDISTVKTMVQTYGNVSMSFYYSDSYMDYSTGGYYNTNYTSTNHAVNIVGWDDNYSSANFVMEPSSDGAWLVKNNWGSDWGDDGYFWLSYEDVSLTGTNAFGFVYEFESADNYDYIYQYDGSYGYYQGAVESGGSVANVFTVQGSSYEKLSAVSLACYSTDVTYSLQVYKNPDSDDPESGTAMLDSPQTGTISYTGYVTIPIKQTDVIFARGDTFSVVFTLKSSDSQAVRVFVDQTYTNGGWIRFVNDTEAGQSYYKSTSGGSWTDLGTTAKGISLGTDGTTVRIKAFTDKASAVPVTGVTLSKTSLSLTLNKTSTLTAACTPAHPTESTTVTWSSSDTSVAKVSSAGKVTAVGVGTATITAKIGSKKATCAVTVALAAPTLKTATATGYKTIKLTWKAVTGASGYRVYRKVSGGSWKKIADVTGKSYTDTVPSSSKSYIYTVKAWTKDSSGTKVWSSCDKTGLTARAVPEAPTLTKTAVSSSGIKLTWQTVTADGYRVYRKTGSGSWKRIKTIKDGSATSWLDTTAVAGKTYTYTVRAIFLKGSKAAAGSYDKTGLTASMTPKKVTLVKASSVTKGIKVTWKSVDSTGYRIYRKTSGGKWKKIATVKGKSTTSYTDTTAKKGTTYYYTVRAYYKTGSKVGWGTYDTTGLKAKRK